MQEEVENRTLTLVVSGTKFTGRMFKAAISKYMAHRKEKKLEKQRSRDAPVVPHGKQTVKTLSALCLTMVVAFGFTIPAFAQGSEQAPAAPAEDSTNDSNVIVEETEPAPALTPDGNAALVDDFGGNSLKYNKPEELFGVVNGAFHQAIAE